MTSRDRQQIDVALNNWRDSVLHSLRDELIEAKEERRDAEENLAIAARNLGEVDADLVGWLHSQWESACISSVSIVRVHDRIAELDLAGLIVLFQRTSKVNTYPWEGDQWVLPDYL